MLRDVIGNNFIGAQLGWIGAIPAKTSNLGEGVETGLILTPLRAFWLWNAAGIDLNQLKAKKFKTVKPW